MFSTQVYSKHALFLRALLILRKNEFYRAIFIVFDKLTLICMHVIFPNRNHTVTDTMDVYISVSCKVSLFTLSPKI
jgi:hypothetical protein